MRQMALLMRGEKQVFSMGKSVRYSQDIWTCECIENYLDDKSERIFISVMRSKHQPVSSGVNTETSTF